ncbi:hypothetical protein [Pedobacter duraquae]|uniref:YfhD-like protein n=1 Tax=Pedobacter duraquae TaxID=425511 RepID=A0A4R6IEI1_9SPHI|nr:hypothetical protein [Pedobacter duraquae]TDO20703.1 hypothetical protein CLV32_3336 [Pedobacter duraquae]
MTKNKTTGNQKEKSVANSTKTGQRDTNAPENDTFISEKDEVKYAEDKLREQVKKKM